MAKNTYLATSYEENDKYYSHILKVENSENLLSTLKRKNIRVAQICSSKKEAENLVNFWNECYRANKTYFFDN